MFEWVGREGVIERLMESKGVGDKEGGGGVGERGRERERDHTERTGKGVERMGGGGGAI